MGNRLSGSIVTAAIAAAAVGAAISVSVIPSSAQAPAASGAALKTPWGEPDLQGIWTEMPSANISQSCANWRRQGQIVRSIVLAASARHCSASER